VFIPLQTVLVYFFSGFVKLPLKWGEALLDWLIARPVSFASLLAFSVFSRRG